MSVSYTAQNFLSLSGYTTDDFAVTVAEQMLDYCISHVNLLADSAIAAMSGNAGSKTVSLSSDELACVQLAFNILAREIKRSQLTSAKYTSAESESSSRSFTVHGISVSEGGSVSTSVSLANALNTNSPLVDMFRQAIETYRAKLALANSAAGYSAPIAVGYFSE